MKSYFDNKQCIFCKGKAIKFRLIKDRHQYLCDDKECDIKSQIQSGYYTPLPITVENKDVFS